MSKAGANCSAVVLAAALTGCATGGADVIQETDSVAARGGFVREIVIKEAPPNIDQAFQARFVEVGMETLKSCAKGPNPLRLEVALGEFKQASGLQTYMVGAANRIRGAAKLVEPDSGKVVGDYDIYRSYGGTGLIGVLALRDGAGRMSEAFAKEVCKRAFAAK